MKVIPYRNFGEQDHKEMFGLIIPDDQGPFALRYLWIQHRHDNENFVENYFNQGNQVGYNVRKQTAHLQQHWSYHNKIFETSAFNGDLVWRAKVSNPYSMSIDYIEVWKNLEIVENYFGGEDAKIGSENWEIDDKHKFAESLYEEGFDIRVWYPYCSISKESALYYYRIMVEKSKKADSCIINTRWNKDLHPYA